MRGLLLSIAVISLLIHHSHAQARAYSQIQFFTDDNCTARWIPALDSPASSYASWFNLLSSQISLVDRANRSELSCIQPRYIVQATIGSAQFQCSSNSDYYNPHLNATLFGSSIQSIEYFNSTVCAVNQTDEFVSKQVWEFYGMSGGCLKGSYLLGDTRTNLTAFVTCHGNSAERLSSSLMLVVSVVSAMVAVVMLS